MDAARYDLGRQCFEAHQYQRQTFKDIAVQRHWYTPDGKPSRGRVERLIRDYKRSQPPQITELPKPIKPKTSPTDFVRWQEMLGDLRSSQYVTVSHICDVHFPFHDPQALQLAYHLIEQKQPQVIVVGSDTADFSVLSSFSMNPDHDEQIDDALDNFRFFWRPHIKTIRKLAPSAHLVFILGNHCQRIYGFLADNAPKLRHTVDRAWIETIRCDGNVSYIGRVEQVEIGNLLVKHGDKVGDNAAKALLDAESYQVSVIAGHIHRRTDYSRVGYHGTVQAATSGCLCDFEQPYLKRPPSRKWEHGTCLATVDLKGTDVFIDNIPFRRQDNGNMIAVTGGQIVTLKAA